MNEFDRLHRIFPEEDAFMKHENEVATKTHEGIRGKFTTDFQRAFSSRYILSLNVVLQIFDARHPIYSFQIHKVHAIQRSVVIFSSPQLIFTTKKVFDEKKFIENFFGVEMS